MRKENNNRRFPGESSSNRPDLAEKRREEAKERQSKTNKLTPQQRLEALDMKLGVNQGAKKERIKLQNKLNKKVTTNSIEELTTSTIPSEVMMEIDALNETSSKKKLKAKDRRAQNRTSNN